MVATISLKGWIFIIVLFVSGTAGALLYKYLCQIPVQNNSGKEEYFDHAYLMTLFMYLGQFLDVVVLQISNQINRMKESKQKQNIEQNKEKQQVVDDTQQESQGKDEESFNTSIFLMFMCPMLIDVIGSTLYNIAMKFALVSVCQMVRNCSVVFVAIFSAIQFKQFRQQFDLPQVVGLSLLISGMITICTVSFFKDNQQKSAPNNFLGVVICIISQLFSSIVFVMEEILFRKIKMSGMHAVSSEGFFGCLIYIFIIFTLDASYFLKNNQYFAIEDLSRFNSECRNNYLITTIVVLYIFSIVFYSWSSLETTNLINAVARSMFDSSKTVLVWIFSLAFKWEKADWIGTPFKLVGYVLVTSGTLIYNRVWKCVPNKRVQNLEGFQKMVQENKETWRSEIKDIIDDSIQ